MVYILVHVNFVFVCSCEFDCGSTASCSLKASFCLHGKSFTTINTHTIYIHTYMLVCISNSVISNINMPTYSDVFGHTRINKCTSNILFNEVVNLVWLYSLSENNLATLKT